MLPWKNRKFSMRIRIPFKSKWTLLILAAALLILCWFRYESLQGSDKNDGVLLPANTAVKAALNKDSVSLTIQGKNPDSASGSATTASKLKQLEKKPLDINAATAEQFDVLPGIGPAKSKAIVDYRAAHGSFQKLEDLLHVKGIGPKTLEHIRKYIHIQS